VTVCMTLGIVDLIPQNTLPLVTWSEKFAPRTLLSLISPTVNWMQLFQLYDFFVLVSFTLLS